MLANAHTLAILEKDMGNAEADEFVVELGATAKFVNVPPWPDYKPMDAHSITSVLCSDNAFFVCAYTTVAEPPSHNIGLLI